MAERPADTVRAPVYDPGFAPRGSGPGAVAADGEGETVNGKMRAMDGRIDDLARELSEFRGRFGLPLTAEEQLRA